MRHALAGFAIVFATAAIYYQTIGFDFVIFDDDTYLTENARMRDGLSAENVRWSFTTMYFSNWHPLTWLSYFLDSELFGVNSAAFHATNVVLHALNGLLLYALLVSMTGSVWPAAAVALLFICHPLHVESVAWVSERKDLLSGLFGILALLAWAGYARDRAWSQYFASLVLFAVGLMAKPMLVTLPFVMLLLDYWPLERMRNRSEWVNAVAEKVPFIALSAASCVITYQAQEAGGAVLSAEAVTLPDRLLNAVVAHAAYLANTFWPQGLAVFYPLPENGHPWLLVAASGALLAMGTVVALRTIKTRPYLFTGWFWFTGMLVPVIGIVQVGGQAYADRYTYLPLTGLFIAIVWEIRARVLDRTTMRRAWAVAAVAILAGLSALSWIQARYWRDSETLFRRALAVTQGNYLAHTNMAAILLESNPAEAEWHIDQALNIIPDYPWAHANLGLIRQSQGRIDEALAHFEKALRPGARGAGSHINRGAALMLKARYEEAESAYQDALDARPGDPLALIGLGEALLAQNDAAGAVEAFRQCTTAHPDNVDAWNGLGRAHSLAEQFSEAAGAYRNALDVTKTTRPDIVTNLANALAQSGDLAAALEHYETALRIDPNRPLTHVNYAAALFLSGRKDDAARHVVKARELDAAVPVPKELEDELGL